MVQVGLQLNFPRDARYVGVLRKVAVSLLDGLDVPRDSVDDLTIALSEACSNAVLHARGSDECDVQVTVAARACVIEVCDLGGGLDRATFEAAAAADPPPTAEFGRGLPLIRALMDDLQIVRDHGTTTVRLIKRWHDQPSRRRDHTG
jgi:serine/threonine-protein kinase RsbW